MPGESAPLLADRPGGTTKLSLLFTIICLVDLLGVFPVVVLPRAVIDCGWYGVPVCLCVFVLEIYTALLLGRSWIIASEIQPDIASKSRYPYAALGELTYGPSMRKCATVLLDICIFSVAVPNLLFVAQSLQLLGIKTSVGQMSFCYWLLILAVILCPIMWLGSPKDLKWLSIVSACGVMMATLLTWLCMFTEPPAPFPVQYSVPTWESVFVAFGIMVFLFELHPTLLVLQVDMKDKYEMGNAIICCFIVVGGLSLTTSVIAEVKFGDLVMPNVLEHLSGSPAMYVNIFVMSVQIFLSMAVAETALFQDLEDLLKIPREFCWKRCVVRSAMVASAMLLAEVMPRFDLMMAVIGGAITCPLVFIFPPLFYTRLRRLQLARFQERCVPHVVYTPEEGGVALPAEAGGSSRCAEKADRAPGGCSWLRMDQQPCEMSLRERAALLLVVCVGCLGTLLASYFCLRATVVFGVFAPPCFL